MTTSVEIGDIGVGIDEHAVWLHAAGESFYIPPWIPGTPQNAARLLRLVADLLDALPAP